MAVNPGTEVEVANNVDAATHTLNYTVSPGASLLMVWFAAAGNTLEPTMASDVDGALTLVPSSSVANGVLNTDRRVAIFYLLNPTVGAHVITVTRDTVLQAGYVINEYSGVDTATPFGTCLTEVAADSASSLAVTDAGDDDLVGDILSTRNTNLATQGADQTLVAQFLLAAGVNRQLGHSTQDGAIASDVMSWTLAGSENHAQAAVAIKAAAAGA